MARFRVRSSLLRDVKSGFSYGQDAPTPTQPRDKPDSTVSLLGPESIRTDSLSNTSMVNRERRVFLPAPAMYAGLAAPVLGAQGTLLQYSAWLLPNGVDSAVNCLIEVPKDYSSAQDDGFPAIVLYTVKPNALAGSCVWTISGSVRGFYNLEGATNMNGGLAALYSLLALTPAGQDVGVGNALAVPTSTFVAGFHYQVVIKRVGTNVGDTLAGNIGVYGFGIMYTADM